jgi:hypothetical protein
MHLLFDGYSSLGPRVPPNPRLPLPDRERAEVPQLDTIAARHRRDDLAEDRVDDILRVALVEMRGSDRR